MKSLFGVVTMLLFISFTSCKKTAGEAADVNDAAAVAAANGVEYLVDLTASAVNWEGTKPTGTHTGTISLSNGSVTVADGNVTGGSFTIDMNTINVTDLEGEWKEKLEVHLKGLAEDNADHFFNVTKFPTGKFEITKVTSLSNDPDGTHLVYGNLTLKETTKEVGFKARVETSNGMLMVSSPQFKIDRTQWGVNYGSKSIFSDLGDKFVNDEIALSINVKASAPAM